MSVEFKVSPTSVYVISTSGRLSSLRRYRRLLQEILKVDVVYLPIHSGNSDNPAISPVSFSSVLKGLPCLGGAISKDIKHSIIPFLDELDESAKDLQSVNTVIVSPSKALIGYNTDAIGFKIAIQNGIASFNQTAIETAVCYGYGGVAFVVVNVLRSLGIRCFIAGRSAEKASQRAAELSIDAWSSDLPPCHLFVNATPASEHPLSEAPNFLGALSGAKMVFDHEMPGQHLQTYCQENGIFHIPGTAMYYPQMAAQWRLFLKGLVADEVLSEQLPDLLKQAEVDSFEA